MKKRIREQMSQWSMLVEIKEAQVSVWFARIKEWLHEKLDGICVRGRAAWNNQAGIAVVEIILVLVVLIGLVLIFKSQLLELVDDIFETITSESSTV